MSETLVPIQMPVAATGAAAQPPGTTPAPATGAGGFLAVLAALLGPGGMVAEDGEASTPASPAGPAVGGVAETTTKGLSRPTPSGRLVPEEPAANAAQEDGATEEETAADTEPVTGEEESGEALPTLPARNDQPVDELAPDSEAALPQQEAEDGVDEETPRQPVAAPLIPAAPQAASGEAAAPGSASAAASTGPAAPPMPPQKAQADGKPGEQAEARPQSDKSATTGEAQARQPADEARLRQEASQAQGMDPSRAARPQARLADAISGNDAPPPKPDSTSTSLSTLQQVGADTIALPRMAGLPQNAQQPVPGTPAPAARPDMPALALQIATQARGGNTRFDIELDPPELGRIDVRIEVSRDGRMTTYMTVDRPDTLDALMRDARGLERALQSTGLKLDDGSVQYHLRDQSSFAQHERDGARGQGRAAHGEAPEDETRAVPEPQLEAYRRLRLPGAVDIRI